MILYASRTGTKRNLAAMRAEGWRLLISSAGVHRDEGFPFAIDNGKWTAHTQGTPWDEAAFRRLLRTHGPRADFIALPDIVCGGLASLDLSVRWLDELRGCSDLVDRTFVVVVQDGMEAHDVASILSPSVGLFVGGSTDWKERTMGSWCALARERGALSHVGRVNSVRRVHLCALAGANSCDGSSGSRYAETIRTLSNAARQTDFCMDRAA